MADPPDSTATEIDAGWAQRGSAPPAAAEGGRRTAATPRGGHAMKDDLQKIIDWIGNLQSRLDRSDPGQSVAYHRMELAKLELGENMRASLPR
jgi:hypothetical protein